jgi:hypothetical protein
VTPEEPEGLLRVLAWVHPAWMLVSILAAAAALRLGLRLRRERRAGARRSPELRRRHLRVARPAVAALLAGFAAGPVSAVALRGFEPFATFHGAVGVAVALLFAGAAWLGHELARGRSRSRDLHALLGGLGVLLAALAAVAGFVLLP